MMAFSGVPLIVLTPGAGDEYNINTAAGSPPNAVRVEATFNSNRTSTSTSNPGIRTGTSWRAGSDILIRQNATCSGKDGDVGATGATGLSLIHI